MNCLLDSKKAARVSSTPGRTQAINLFTVRDRYAFADLPGYGFAKVPGAVKARWKGMIESYLGTRETLVLVVVFIDVRRDPVSSDRELIEGLQAAEIPILIVATKADKLKRRALDKQRAALRRAYELPKGQPVLFSSVTKDGRDTVWRAIRDAAEGPRDG